MIRSVDELSDLEEFIHLRCVEAAEKGFTIGESFDGHQWCPLHAVAGRRNVCAGINILGLSDSEAAALMGGFDTGVPFSGNPNHPELRAMGARFRARTDGGEYVLSGEYRPKGQVGT